jgi:hypothetical protein
MRYIAPAVRGRLALYRLISETPQGWMITEAGKSALREAPKRQEVEEAGAVPDRPRGKGGKRLPHRRNFPFL